MLTVIAAYFEDVRKFGVYVERVCHPPCQEANSLIRGLKTNN